MHVFVCLLAGKMKTYFKDCDIKYIEPTTMIR